MQVEDVLHMITPSALPHVGKGMLHTIVPLATSGDSIMNIGNLFQSLMTR